MIPVRNLLRVLLAGLALSACSGQAKLGVSPPAPPAAPAPLTSPAPILAPAPALAPAPEGTAPPDEGGKVVVSGPDGAVWTKSGATADRIRADMDNCFSYARAQIAHDVRIEEQPPSTFDTSFGGLGLIELQSRMNAFERNRRTPALVSACMRAKGYAGR